VSTAREKIGGITPLVVGGIMFAALVVVTYHLAGPIAGGACILLLAYEGWTLVNKYPQDTISEILWMLSARPIVPWLFGVATGAWLMHLSYQPAINPRQLWITLAIGFLEGHFFFQAQKNQEEAQATKVAEAVVVGAEAADAAAAIQAQPRFGGPSHKGPTDAQYTGRDF